MDSYPRLFNHGGCEGYSKYSHRGQHHTPHPLDDRVTDDEAQQYFDKYATTFANHPAYSDHHTYTTSSWRGRHS